MSEKKNKHFDINIEAIALILNKTPDWVINFLDTLNELTTEQKQEVLRQLREGMYE